MKFSIIINNYNYDAYLAEAIDSALAVDWPETEVIVIDDGSTDGSRDVIRGYGDRITALFVPNAGQNQCLHRALPHASGEIVMVLDSDDILDPQAPAQVAAVWGPGVVKVQFALQYYDATMTRKGHVWPVYDARHTPDYMRRRLHETGTCPYSVTSGTMWSRAFLETVLSTPLDPRLRSGFDQLLGRLAPAFGDVISLPQTLVRYRVHDNNLSRVGVFSVASLQRALDREAIYQEALTAILARHGKAPPAQNRSEPILMCQLTCKKLVGGARYAFGGWLSLLRRYWSAVLSSETRLARKAAMIGWSIVVALLPSPYAVRVCSLRQRANRRF